MIPSTVSSSERDHNQYLISTSIVKAVKVQLLIIDGEGKVYQKNPRVMLDRSEQLRREKKALACKR